MEVKRISWQKAIREWEKIEKVNTVYSPYMDINFQKIFKKVYRLGYKRWNKKLVIFQFTSDNNKKIICPLMMDKTDAYIMGDLCQTGYLDLIYPVDVLDSDFDNIIKILQEKLNRRIHFNKLNQSGLFTQYMLKYYEPISKQICVNIKIPDCIEKYYASLSKSTRQNYRTSKNRMAREGKIWSVEVRTKKINAIEKKQMLKVYVKREEEREKKKISSLVKFVQLNINPITIGVSKLPNNFNAYFLIDEEVAGFLSGFISNDETTVVVPRLAINSKYAVYCPGTLLIYEVIDWIIQNSKIRNLDLSRGNEKYKYAMGGTEHYNYDFIL